MKFVDEACRKAQERVRRYAAMRSLKKEIEQQKACAKQKLQQLQERREHMQRFVIRDDVLLLPAAAAAAVEDM